MIKPKDGKLSDSPWMPHDLDCTADPKFYPLISKFGGLAYAVFWRVNELLHQEPEHKLELSEPIIEGVCGLFKMEQEQVMQIIAYAIKCGLYTREGEYIFSERVIRNITRRQAVADKRKEAATKRWDANAKQKQFKSNANAMQTDAIRVEESRGDTTRKGSSISEHSELPNHGAQSAPDRLWAVVAAWPGQTAHEKDLAKRLFGVIDLDCIDDMLDEIAKGETIPILVNWLWSNARVDEEYPELEDDLRKYNAKLRAKA